jgi:hypothetical protein
VQNAAHLTQITMQITRACNSRLVSAQHHRDRHRLTVKAYASSSASVRCIQPASDIHETEAAIKTLGQVGAGQLLCSSA